MTIQVVSAGELFFAGVTIIHIVVDVVLQVPVKLRDTTKHFLIAVLAKLTPFQSLSCPWFHRAVFLMFCQCIFMGVTDEAPITLEYLN